MGLHTDLPSQTAPDGRWLENVAPRQLFPEDLHRAQLTRRLGTE